MIKLFLYDNVSRKVILNEPDILLIKEFNDLWANDRNKCKEDKTGEQHLRAFRELKYIYLAIDWRSPYKQYSEHEKMEYAKKDAELTQQEFDDPVFRAACRKYQELQSKSKIGTLLKAQYDVIDRMINYYQEIDLDERDDQRKPIFKVKDIISEMASMSKALDGLKQLEEMWMKEQVQESFVRGGQKPGFLDR